MKNIKDIKEVKGIICLKCLLNVKKKHFEKGAGYFLALKQNRCYSCFGKYAKIVAENRKDEKLLDFVNNKLAKLN